MSEQDTRQNGEENFEAMLDAYTGSMSETLRVGDKVKGAVISITADSVFIDTGTKIDGVAERAELLNDEGELTVAEGDEVELFVVAVSATEIRLSKAVGGAGSISMLEDAFNGNLPVEGRVMATRKGGFDIEVLKRRAFCPVSQIDARFVENAEEYVGQTFQFQIIKFEQNGRNVVVSRRALLEREIEEKREEFLKDVKEGDQLDGTVSRLAAFGAFVELAQGVEGLVHLSELSWSRVSAADEAVSPGDTIRVKILGMETDKKGQLRISLSAKQVQENPWNRVEAELKEGEVMEGKVVRLAQFGAFVELLPGVDGLVHVSEMSYAKRVHKPEDMVAVGDKVSVKIKGIDFGQQRISLSMRDAEGDPWADVGKRFAPGTTVEGTVESHTDFGVFVSLAPGVTGLMPKSLLAKAANAKELETIKPGSTICVVVSEVRATERRISLAPEGVEVTEDTSWKKYSKPSRPRTERPSKGGSQSFGDAGSFGSLGSALEQAMKKNNK